MQTGELMVGIGDKEVDLLFSTMVLHVKKSIFTLSCQTKKSLLSSGESHIGIRNIHCVISSNTSGIVAFNKSSLTGMPKEKKSKNMLCFLNILSGRDGTFSVMIKHICVFFVADRLSHVPHSKFFLVMLITK